MKPTKAGRYVVELDNADVARINRDDFACVKARQIIAPVEPQMSEVEKSAECVSEPALRKEAGRLVGEVLGYCEHYVIVTVTPAIEEIYAALIAARNNGNDEIKRLKSDLIKARNKYAELCDKMNGTPCEQIRHQQELSERDTASIMVRLQHL